MGWTELRDAMQAAIVAASALPASSVIWKYQDRNQPALPYAALTISPLSNPGQDGLVASTDLGRPAGQEVKLELRGFREAVLGVEVFTASVADSSDALALGDRIGTALRLPSVRDPLGLVGVTPFDVGPVQYVPAVVAAGFRGRAVLEIRCFVPGQALYDLIGYIASVGGNLTTSGGSGGTNVRPFTAP